MSLEDLLEAKLAGKNPEVPAELREDVEHAVAAHAALQGILEVAASASNPDVDRPPPALPGDYEIIRELGRGGMGVVYLARQRSLGREVAVKVLRPGEAMYRPLVKRFLEEARHLARLRHPNIVSIHEIGKAGEEPYFTMDYVEGEPLSGILARSIREFPSPDSPRNLVSAPTLPPKPTAETASFSGEASATISQTSASEPQEARKKLSPTQALAILKQAAAGVQHAHEHGIIHRDLKPGNILVDSSGHAYVTDFGLARDMAQNSKLTRSGEVMGTPAYMAPEQARGQKELIGETTDVHALGAILYEMLTGKLPYGSDAPLDVIMRLISAEPTPPRKIDRRIPRDLETICLKALAKTPDKRYASVRAFLEDIRRYESGEPVLARRPGPLARAARLVKRHWKLEAAVIVTAAVVVITVLLIAPRLFDKSVAELLQWAQEQQFSGRKEDALRTYARAYRRTNSLEDRDRILTAMLACAQGMEPKKVGEAVQEVIDVDPGVSFQQFDFAVAEAWANPGRWEQLRQATPEAKRRGLETAEKRLLLVTGGSYANAAEKQVANEHLTKVRDMLATLETAPNLVFELPIGEDPAKLLEQAAKPDEDWWKAGKAAFAAGVELEKAGDKPKALAAYKQAYDLIRRACPIYSRLCHGVDTSRSRNEQPEATETRLLREVLSSLKRLDPNTPDTLRGGIRFRIDGPQIPRGVALFLHASLWQEPKPKKPSFGYGGAPDGAMAPMMPGGFPIQMDGTAWIGVADGKYRLRVWSTSSGGGGKISEGAERDANDVDFSKLVFDFADVTKDEIEIRGQTVEIPIRSRLLKELAVQTPMEGAALDLNTVIFAWAETPGAKSYTISLWYEEKIPGGVRGNEAWSKNIETTRYALADLPAKDNAKFAPLKAGVKGTFHVTAYDAKSRQLAGSKRSFVVTRELAGK